jgi:hypothetical protein
MELSVYDTTAVRSGKSAPTPALFRSLTIFNTNKEYFAQVKI